MKPILYESTRTQFNDNGIGILSDAVSCFVTEERNGRFELVLNYPVDGIHYKEIKQRSIIAAKAHADGNVQPFRVYRITKPLNGTVSIYAEHISYDLSGIAVSPFDAGSAAAALQGIKTNSVIENPFEFWTDKSTVAQMSIKTPASARAVLGGVAG
jgi:phage-related protein